MGGRHCPKWTRGFRFRREVASVPFSSAEHKYEAWRDFLIRDTEEDFPATGLARTSHASGVFDEFDTTNLIKRLGRLEGELLDEFKDWFG